MKNLYFVTLSLLAFGCKDTPSENQKKLHPVTENIRVTKKNMRTDERKPEESLLQEKKENPEKKPEKFTSVNIRAEKSLEQSALPTPNTNNPQESMSENPKSIPKVDFSGVYGQILSNFVSATGKVNYKGIKTNRELLRQATFYFEENPPTASWSRNEKLAYWINAYNLYTLELVVDNYPVTSIKDIANGKPWDKKFIKIDGRTLSLNEIENEIIRKEFDEPRIHFAVNCASISCPKLINKPYTAGNLNSLLASQTKLFINDDTMNTITPNVVEISNIFDWYKSDFTKSGTVLDFLNSYSETKINTGAKITYKTYNWNLNQ